MYYYEVTKIINVDNISFFSLKRVKFTKQHSVLDLVAMLPEGITNNHNNFANGIALFFFNLLWGLFEFDVGKRFMISAPNRINFINLELIWNGNDL